MIFWIAATVLLFSLSSCSQHTNFAVVVDIGSTGSRAHVFEFGFDRTGCNGAGAAHVKLPEKSSKIRPGFSTFLDSRLRESSISRQTAVSEYLNLIKNEIDGLVPESRRGRTPVWLLGTAGMRHFSGAELAEIFGYMRGEVAKSWEYKTHPDWIDVLDGENWDVELALET